MVSRKIWPVLVPLALFATAPAIAEMTVYELRITNDTGTDLTFQLHDGKSKKVHLTYEGEIVHRQKIKAGTSDTIGIRPYGDKCVTACGGCTAAIGKVYAYYKDAKGDQQRNNYYQVDYEFFEYCGVSGNKAITAYTSNWYFDHGTGKGTGKFSHHQKDSSKAYSSGNPAQGITFDAKYVSGHANITYYED